MSKGVFLIGFGGPASSAEVRPFLDSVLQGRPVPPERVEEVVRQYASIGGSSPYNAQARELADHLARRLAADGRPWPVYAGFRHAAPSFSDALTRMADDGVTEAAGVILSSFRSEPSWDRYVSAVEDSRRALGPRAPRVTYTLPWNEDVLFLQALEARIRETESALPVDARRDAHWLFTAHSIPMSADHPSRYAEQIRRTAALVSERMGHANWDLCWQSRSGSPEDPWLEPDVAHRIADLNQARSLEVLVIPVGFVNDHVEVLFDLDVKARRAAESRGFSFHRAPTVGLLPDFVKLLGLRAVHALSRAEENR